MSELSRLKNRRFKRRKRRKLLRKIIPAMLAFLFVCSISLVAFGILKNENDPGPVKKTADEQTDEEPAGLPSEEETAETGGKTDVTSENIHDPSENALGSENRLTSEEIDGSEEIADDEEAEINKETAENRASFFSENPAENYANPGVIVSDATFTNIRRSPDSGADIIGKAMVYSLFEVLDTEDGWVHIASEGKEGYVSAEFVKTGEEAKDLSEEHCSMLAFSDANKVKAYQSPDQNSAIVFTMYAENGYEVQEENDDWVKLQTNEGEEGYVERKHLTIRHVATLPYFFEEEEALSDLRREIIDYAFQWYGGAYVWGGLTLGVGVDCSGYCLRVYQHFGIELPRLSIDQAKWGTAVNDISEIEPGDLLFFRGFYDDGTLSEGVGHVGIYIGNGKMIHAASKERGITVDTYNYLEEPLCIRRVIND